MTDQTNEATEDFSDESPEETLEWFNHYAKTIGLRVAMTALTAVCRDPKAPAPAKSSAAGFLLRAAGALKNDDSGNDQEPHTMTSDQLQREVARLQRKKKKLSAGNDDSESDDPGGVFD